VYRNYVTLGPVRIRISKRHLADWGYPIFSIGGLSFFTRSTNGDMIMVSCHPKGSITWHWGVTWSKTQQVHWITRSKRRDHQWFDIYKLPLVRRCIIIAHQDYHKQEKLR
jgi:hypothetical protein